MLSLGVEAWWVLASSAPQLRRISRDSVIDAPHVVADATAVVAVAAGAILYFSGEGGRGVNSTAMPMTSAFFHTAAA